MTKSGAGTIREREPETWLPHGLLLELENVAFHGRQLMFETMRTLLADKGITLTPNLFSMHGVERCALHGVREIVQAAGKPRVSVEKLAEQIRDHMKQAYLRKSRSFHPGVLRLVKEAAARNHRVAWLTGLDLETARQVTAGHDLESQVRVLLPYASEGKHYPGADAMVEAAKGLELPPSGCVVVCTCSHACRAALASGMRCVAVPDRFTSFQDFSGADHVFDVLDEAAIKTLLAALER